MWVGEVPFSKDGKHQLSYPDYGHVMRENVLFRATLIFDRWERGRSAAHAIFRLSRPGPNGLEEVSVFLRDLGDMFPHMREGKVCGDFTFCKRGANFGCQWVAP